MRLLYASVDEVRLEALKKVGVTIRQLDTGLFHGAAQKVHAEFLTAGDEKKTPKTIQDGVGFGAIEHGRGDPPAGRTDDDGPRVRSKGGGRPR